MSTLKQDVFARGGIERAARARLSATLLVLLLASVALVVLSRIEHPLAQELRSSLERAIGPVIESLEDAGRPVRAAIREAATARDLAGRLEALQAEAYRLQTVEARAREAEERLAALERATRAVPEPPARTLIARVIADGGGPFTQSLVINAGEMHGVRRGQPVLAAGWLVGRVVSVGRRSSRLLLITDRMSRIPVNVGSRRNRAILAGDNTARPELVFTRIEEAMPAGETVSTSGVGGGLPGGLRAGITEHAGDGLRLLPGADLARLDYLSVLLVDPVPADVADDGAVGRRAGLGEGAGGRREMAR
jgi:rod shape-determining protein MreC